MKLTPTWVATFETASQTLIQDSWQRVAQDLIWDKVMAVKKSTTLKELYHFLIESFQLQDEGQGGQRRFDDVSASFIEIDNSNSGLGLTLTRNEIEDNVMASPALRGMPALDYAANWSKQMGGAAGYRPQKLLFDLIAGGKTNAAYDSVAFFGTHQNHPFDSTKGSYTNLITAKPIDATNAPNLADAMTNFAAAVAQMRAFKAPNGVPRHLKVKYAMGGVDLQKRLSEVLDAKFFGGTTAGSTENVLAMYGITPIIVPELTEAGVYYLFAETINDESAFYFQDRSPYELNSFTPMTQAQLMAQDSFLWTFRGRNAGGYGYPYLCARVEPT